MRSEQEVAKAIENHSDMVLRLCMVYLKNFSDAEDIFQVVFTRYAMSSLQFIDPEHEKAWLIRVTVNACKDLLKSFFRRKTVSLDELADQFTEVSPEHIAVIEAVRQLPEKYREVVYLHYYEGYTAPEIAQLLKKNLNTIYSMLRKSKQLLKEVLEDA